MKINRFILCIILVLICCFVCGCKMEHGHFEFVIEEFEKLEPSEYINSDQLNSYKIQDIVIRPWLKKIAEDTYRVSICGYSDNQARDKILYIDSLELYTKNGIVLNSVVKNDTEIYYTETDPYACFYIKGICSFFGDVETVDSYDILYMDLTVTVVDGAESETKTFKYEIDIVEYLTSWPY